MQTGKNAMATVKETVSNVGASAKSGMDKTKATVEGTVKKMTAQHPAEKVEAEQRKQEKMHAAEINKEGAREHNAAEREHARAGVGHHNTSAVTGKPTGDDVTSGVVESHPIGTATGTGRPSAAHNPHTGGDHPTIGGTGAGYT